MSIVDWPKDAPRDALNQAAIVFIDLRGHEDYLAWLEQEISRTRVVIGMHTGHAVGLNGAAPKAAPHAPEPPSVAVAKVESLVEAVSFYADSTNWSGRGGKRSPAQLDEGNTARKALAEYEGGNGGEEQE